MITNLRKGGFRYAVALGIGLSAAAPAQPVTHDAAPVLPVVQVLNEAPSESIRAIIDRLDEPAPVVEAPRYEAIGQGQASYYGRELAGNRTASGERFDPGALTAAHRTLPLGSKLRVTNLSNGMSVIVRINDRGPGARSRIVDLSHAAAKQISMIRSGTAQVRLELVRYS